MLMCLAIRLLFAALAFVQAHSVHPVLAKQMASFALTGMQASVEHAKQMRYCERGDCIVALHRIGNASVIKIVDIK